MDLFQGLDTNLVQNILKNVAITKEYYKKGEIISHEGESCNKLIKLAKGSVIAKQSFLDGHDNIIKIINEGDYIGVNLLFSSNPQYKATFYADSDCKLEAIGKADIISIMQESNVAMINLLSIISDNACELNEHIRLLSYKKIRARLGYFLLNEYNKNKCLEFKIAYTKTSLAAFLNVERPSLSKELSKMISAGIIINDRKYYKILNLEALKGLIDE